MNRKQVTVVIPVYNVAEYIAACVKSVVVQTYGDIEILLVDDGSKDNSIDIAEEVLRNSGRKYRIICQANGGVSAARNNGIAQAEGTLVMALDADDKLRPDAIEKMVALYECNDAQCVVCDFALIGKQDDFTETDEKVSGLVRNGVQACKKYFDREERYVSPAMLLPKAFLKQNQIVYDEKCRFAEDDLYVWNVIAKADRIVYCNQKLYGYVFHENSTMTAATYDRFLSSYSAGKRLWNDVIRESDNTKQIAEQFVFRHVFGVVHAAAKVLRFDAFRGLLEQTDFAMHFAQNKGRGSAKLRMLGLTFCISKKLFYKICRRF